MKNENINRPERRFIDQILQHFKEHHGEKVYSCHLCPKKYNYGNLLSQHLIKKHEFQLPHGHYRFNYRQDLDGFFRVQTTRTESLEVTQQVMKPNYRETTDTTDMNYEISELHESNEGLKIEVMGKPKESTVTTPPIFYDSSNDANLFFTLPDLNFDSNSEEGNTSIGKENTFDAESITESPMKNEIDFAPTDGNVVEGSSSDIKNFSVMKRYLKKENKNNIIIELKEVDEAGVVVKTQIVQADEFSVTTDDKSIGKVVDSEWVNANCTNTFVVIIFMEEISFEIKPRYLTVLPNWLCILLSSFSLQNYLKKFRYSAKEFVMVFEEVGIISIFIKTVTHFVYSFLIAEF